MKVLIVVTGGRNYSDREAVRTALGEPSQGDELMVLSGGATGLDSLVLEWAYDHEINAIRMPAQWDRHGRKAGMLRNQAMIEMARTFWHAGWTILFLAFPGGVGTADMARRMKNAVVEFGESKDESGKNCMVFQPVEA